MWRELGISSWPTFAIIGPTGKLLAQLAGEGRRKVCIYTLKTLKLQFLYNNYWKIRYAFFFHYVCMMCKRILMIWWRQLCYIMVEEICWSTQQFL